MDRSWSVEYPPGGGAVRAAMLFGLEFENEAVSQDHRDRRFRISDPVSTTYLRERHLLTLLKCQRSRPSSRPGSGENAVCRRWAS